MTGAVRVLPQCPMSSGNVRSVSGSSLGTTSFLMPISNSSMLIKLFHIVLNPPQFLVGIHTRGNGMAISSGFPCNYRVYQ